MSKRRKALKFHAKRRSVTALENSQRKLKKAIKYGVNYSDDTKVVLSAADHWKYKAKLEDADLKLMKAKSELKKREFEYKSQLKDKIAKLKGSRLALSEKMKKDLQKRVIMLLKKAEESNNENYAHFLGLCQSETKDWAKIKKAALRAIKEFNTGRPITNISNTILEAVVAEITKAV
jgi:hypothetical protein